MYNDDKLLHSRALARVKIRHCRVNVVHHFANLLVPVLVHLVMTMMTKMVMVMVMNI